MPHYPPPTPAAPCLRTSSEILIDALRIQIDLDGLDPPGPAYDHMGALVVDAALQAGLRYDTVVAPRVRRVLETWPDATTTGEFLSRCMQWGIADVIRWQHPEKLTRVLRLAMTFRDASIDTVDELALWAPTPGGRSALLAIPGIGPKTTDYVARLAGAPAVAIDRHLVSFAVFAGVEIIEYRHLADAYRSAATSLDVDLAALDQRVWLLMSTDGLRPTPTTDLDVVPTTYG